MAGRHSLTEEQEKWLLVLATPKKAAVAMTIPRAVQLSLMQKGLIQIIHTLPRATAEGKAELLRVMML